MANTINDFVHLHNHSYYSLLDGLCSPKELVETAAKLGYKSLALTDHGNVAGLYQFQKYCKINGIKPILGMEAYITDDHTIKTKETKTRHLIILAKNSIGYKNLIYLSSFGFINGFYSKPRIDFKILAEHHEGLIVTSACLNGEIAYTLERGTEQEADEIAAKYKAVFGDDYYIEIMSHHYHDKEQEEREKNVARKLFALSKRMGIKAICTQDIHYTKCTDCQPHDVLLCIQTLDNIKNPNRFSFRSPDFYMKSVAEMSETFKKAPELLINTAEIADKIESNLIQTFEDALPPFKLPEGYDTEEKYLKDLVVNGMKEKGLFTNPLYRERIKYEMGVIERCKYTRYFLILWDMLNYAKQNGIRIGVGRGCFIEGSMVDCEVVTKTIESITKDDKVLAYDGKYHEVINILQYETENEEIVDIEFYDGRVISCTSDHKIHILRGSQLEWIEAKELCDQCFVHDIWEKDRKTNSKIKSIKFRKYTGKLYDLTVKDVFSYNINGLSVHNSAGGSLCLYVMDVVKLDPIKYDLLFERFLNPDRVSPPDVDVDFDFNRRDEVFDYIFRKYGQEYCSKIGTYNKLKGRAVIRGSVKALDLANDWEYMEDQKKKNPNSKPESPKRSLQLADMISKQIPFGPNVTIDSSIKDSAEFKASMTKYPKLLESAKRLEGCISSAGVHAAGIVISKDKLIDKIPMRVSNGVVCSQYDKDEVEEIGLLKFDLLAIKNLTTIQRCLEAIKQRHPKVGMIDIDRIEPDDQKVFECFNGTHGKNTKGIFQFESFGMVKLLKNLNVDSFHDLVVAVALYRPGPLGAKMHDEYCDFKHKRKKQTYLHPKMGEALGDTYGIMVFQENIMKVVQVMAGFTGGQADTLRKAVGKKKPELLKKQHDLFIDGCAKNNISQDVAEAIFKQIDYFSGYGFNKSHSVSYGFIAYQMAYLKTYYPIEFMCSLLSDEMYNNDQNLKLNEYINEAKNGMKIITMPQHINRSGLEYKIEKANHVNDKHGEIEILRSPLTTLKGIGDKAVKNIVANQPYKDLYDFIKRIDSRIVNIRVFTTLVNSGCMDCWEMPKAKLLAEYEILKKQIDKEKKSSSKKAKNEVEDNRNPMFEEFDSNSLNF